MRYTAQTLNVYTNFYRNVFTVEHVKPQTFTVRYGLVVRIAGSHPAGPGSIPGNGNLLITFKKNLLNEIK